MATTTVTTSTTTTTVATTKAITTTRRRFGFSQTAITINFDPKVSPGFLSRPNTYKAFSHSMKVRLEDFYG